MGDFSKGKRGAPPTQSLGLVKNDFVFASKLSRQELVIFICFRRQHSAAPTAPGFYSLSFSPTHSPLFSVFLVCGGMLTCTLKGLWQVCEQKIVPKPLTKVSLNSGETMNNTGYICGMPVPQHLSVLHGKTSLEMQQCPQLVNRETAPTTGRHSSGDMK